MSCDTQHTQHMMPCQDQVQMTIACTRPMLGLGYSGVHASLDAHTSVHLHTIAISMTPSHPPLHHHHTRTPPPNTPTHLCQLIQSSLVRDRHQGTALGATSCSTTRQETHAVHISNTQEAALQSYRVKPLTTCTHAHMTTCTGMTGLGPGTVTGPLPALPGYTRIAGVQIKLAYSDVTQKRSATPLVSIKSTQCTSAEGQALPAAAMTDMRREG